MKVETFVSTHSDVPTPLEARILSLYYERYTFEGFPSPETVRVSERKNTGAGRYTYFHHSGTTAFPDGDLNIGRYGQLEVDSLQNGASYHIYVQKGILLYLEIDVNGVEDWDGSETAWAICDPDTGRF